MVSSAHSMKILVIIFVILISTYIVNSSVLDPVIENVVHLQASKPPSGVPGIWKKKTIWKPRWVKGWKSAKVMKPVWRKVWSPVQIREWVPIPKPPPGWNSGSTPLAPVKITGKNNLKKDNTPLWDPVPYPQSQQPPPLSDNFYLLNKPCGKECKEPLTFNHRQIADIISSNKYENSPDYYQGSEYSESVTHTTRIPSNENNWRSSQYSSNFQFENQFNFPELPSFLVPPKYQQLYANDFQHHFRNQIQQPQFQPLPNNNISFQFRNHNQQSKFHNDQTYKSKPNGQNQINQSPAFEIGQHQNKELQQWIPFPPQSKIKSHFYEFELPETEIYDENTTRHHDKRKEVLPDNKLSVKPNYQTHNINTTEHPQKDSDFIQEAQLVGEYHYSEFDIPGRTISESKKPELNIFHQEEKLKLQQKNTTPQVQHQKTQKEEQRSPQIKQIKADKTQLLQNTVFHNKLQMLQPQDSVIVHSTPKFLQSLQSTAVHKKPQVPQPLQPVAVHKKPQTSQLLQPTAIHKPQMPQSQSATVRSNLQVQQLLQPVTVHKKPQVLQSLQPTAIHSKPQLPHSQQSTRTHNNLQVQQSLQSVAVHKKSQVLQPSQSTLIDSKPQVPLSHVNLSRSNSSYHPQKNLSKETFPIFTTANVDPISIPSNHRFSSQIIYNPSTKFSLNFNSSNEKTAQSLKKELVQQNFKSEIKSHQQSLSKIQELSPTVTPKMVLLNVTDKMNSSTSNHNFQQQKAITKEISPITKIKNVDSSSKVIYNNTRTSSSKNFLVESTTPITVFSNSSFFTTTEGEKSAVFIVTPSYTINS